MLYLYPQQVQYVRGFDWDRSLVAEGYVEVKPKSGQVIENLRVVMLSTAHITGKLLAEDNQSLDGKRVICVLKYADGVERKRRIRVDSTGRFELDRIQPGIVEVALETHPVEFSGKLPTAFEIGPGQSKDIGEIALKKIKFYKVSGKLLPSPTFTSLKGLKIRLGLREWSPMLSTDAEGRFVLPDVPAGEHRLTAYLPFNCRTDAGVGHVNVEVKDGNLENIQLQLETLATIHMRIVDEEGNPIEGISAAAWWTKNHSGVFTEGTKSNKQGRATLYLYPDQVQYVGAHDWAGKYRLESDKEFNLKPGEVIQDLTVTMMSTGSKE